MASKAAFDFQSAAFLAGSVFTPGSPVNERDLFSGRVEQVNQVFAAASQRGYHAVLFGERGVGKTSIANVLPSLLPLSTNWIAVRVNCDGSDTFQSLWRKLFREITVTHKSTGAGFTPQESQSVSTLEAALPQSATPGDIRSIFQRISASRPILAIFDEFDRVDDVSANTLMADTIKALSDYAVDATILLIGVADSVDELLTGHQSVERALVQIPMPRMSSGEIGDIVNLGLSRLGMSITKDSLNSIESLSQGLPYITHLVALHSVRSALDRASQVIESDDVAEGIRKSLDQWQRSVVKDYYDATQSSQPGNIYKEVLLACALAETDDLGFFTAASVRAPLRAITGRDYDIPNFAQHLKNFGDAGRGEVLMRTGETRRIRYRFSGPLMRPYIIMRGFSDKLISREQMEVVSASHGGSVASR